MEILNLGFDDQTNYYFFNHLKSEWPQLNEKTVIQKTPLERIITYRTDIPKLTKWVNYLPNIDTDVPSTVSVLSAADIVAVLPEVWSKPSIHPLFHV